MALLLFVVGKVLYYLICGGVVVLYIFIILIFIFKCVGVDVENNEFLFLKSGDGDFNGFIDGIVANFYSLYDFILLFYFIFFIKILLIKTVKLFCFF